MPEHTEFSEPTRRNALPARTRSPRRTDETEPKKAVSVGTTCRILNIGNTTAYKLLKDGTLNSIKIGARRLVLMDSIEALLRSSEEVA